MSNYSRIMRQGQINFIFARISYFELFYLKYQMNVDFVFNNYFKYFINDFEFKEINIYYLKRYFNYLFH